MILGAAVTKNKSASIEIFKDAVVNFFIFFIIPSVTKRIDSKSLAYEHPPKKTNIGNPIPIRIFLQAESAEFIIAILIHGAKTLDKLQVPIKPSY